MANEEQLSILKQGVEVGNKWRSEHKSHSPDLSRANLSGMFLGGINLNTSVLREANLEGTVLSLAHLIGADLKNAHLAKINLRAAHLEYADLSGADLQYSFLIATEFDETNLNKANFSQAALGGTLFLEADLSNTHGLEEIDHHSLSYLNPGTLRSSKGKIPIAFLRGCGLSDLDIEYAKLAAPGLDPEQVINITYRIHQLYLGGGIQYYSCFISYNSRDQEFATQLHDDLQNNGVRCWYAPEDLKIGDQIRPRIDQEIRLRDKLLVILSENSLKSEWVGDEVEAALEEESKSNRLVLFPIRLDDTVLSTRDDWAAKIKRRRHIGDFSNWKDKASYQKAFERLLRDLKATGGGVNGE